MIVRAFFLLAGMALLTSQSIADDVVTLQEAGNTRWWRGNMHTHSHWSDGDDYLESIALWYENKGYDFLVFTDHNVLAKQERWVAVDKTKGGRKAYDKLKINFPDWVEERETDGKLEVRLRRFTEVAGRFNKPGEFLLIQGEEISDKFGRKPIHLCAGNVAELIEPQGGENIVETIRNNVRAVLAQREETGQAMMIHLNHPNFGYAVTAEELMLVGEEKFFEVYNGHPGVNNKGNELRAGTEKMWDIMLAHRLALLDLPIMFGVAVDDGHNYHNIPSRKSEPGRGWVVVLTDELTPKSLIEAMERGAFYASSGVELKSISTSPKSMAVEVKPEPGETYTIEFVGTRKAASLKGEQVVDKEGKPVHTTKKYGDEIGEVLHSVQGTSATYEFTGNELYVRARITSSAKHPNPSEVGDFKQAWVQPVVGPAVEE